MQGIKREDVILFELIMFLQSINKDTKNLVLHLFNNEGKS